MALALLPHVHLAVLGADVVLLDTRADAYLCVPDGVTLLRPSPDRATVAPADAATAAELVRAGLARSTDEAAPRSRLARPAADVGGPGEAPLTAIDAVRLAGALWDAVRRYRGRPLGEILAFVNPAGARPARAQDAAAILRLAGLFNRVVVWLPIPRKCLVRSFVLLRFLQRSGLNATWVFGVTTWPFQAHCWLQFADTALDDHAERIVGYEPILAVG